MAFRNIARCSCTPECKPPEDHANVNNAVTLFSLTALIYCLWTFKNYTWFAVNHVHRTMTN